MRRTAALIPMLLAAGGGALAPAGAAQETPSRQIVVTGTGEVATAPDRVTVSAGVETEAATAQEAMERNSTAMRAVMDALAAAAVPDRNVQTSTLGLDPVWRELPPEPRPGPVPQAPEISGYVARNLVTVTLDDPGALGSVVDALVAAGANRMYGVVFSREDRQALEDRAREQAVANARAKAEVLARAAGVTLGPLLTLTEAEADGPLALAARAEASMDTPVAPGSVLVSARVEVVFGLR